VHGFVVWGTPLIRLGQSARVSVAVEAAVLVSTWMPLSPKVAPVPSTWVDWVAVTGGTGEVMVTAVEAGTAVVLALVDTLTV
jgi:hypothetical protein